MFRPPVCGIVPRCVLDMAEHHRVESKFGEVGSFIADRDGVKRTPTLDPQEGQSRGVEAEGCAVFLSIVDNKFPCDARADNSASQCL